MKVTICIGNNKWAIPYSDKDKVGDILQLAVNRYMNYNPKNMDKVIGACHFLTLDGAILYNDDNLCDVIDNNDTIKVAFREDVDLNETETESSTPAEFPDVPRFNKVSSKLAHLQTPPIPPFQNKFSTGPRHKSTGSSKTPDRFKSREEMVASFSRLGGRKSLGSNLMHDHWFEARYKLQGRLETLEDSNNNNSSQSLLDSCSQANNNNNNMSSKHSQSDLTNLTPANRSSSLLAINQSPATTLPPSPPTSKGVGSRPRSAAVKGYVTEFRGREVSTRTLESTKEGSSDLSSLKKKNQSPAVLAPSNTRVIGKMMNITLVKGSSGLGFTITSRDNMADMNSPIYIKNILPGGAAQLDGRLKILDRLLAVNGVDVSNAKQTEATQILRQIPIGQGVELLISRQVEDGDINEGKIATHENLPAPMETTEDHHHHHDEEKLHPSYDTNSFRQPSMTKEMEKFLSSSVSPPCHPLNNEWNVPLKQFLPHSKCNLRPLISEGKVAAMLIRSSPSSPELQLLEIDGQPLTSDLSVSASIDLIKRAINKAWFQEGSNVMARVRKPCLGFFDSYPEESSEICQDDHLTLPASTLSSKGHRNRVQEVKKSPSKSAPTTPIAAKQLRFPLTSDVGEVEREEEEGDHEEGQEGSTFDRKGFGRQSMSEKRKGHADPRSLDFYRQMKSEKNDGRTSYATWDTRKTSRLKKLAADANLKNNSESSSCSDKQYKSMENLLANQNVVVVNEHPMAEQVNDLDMNDAKQGRMGDIDENKKVDGDDDDLHGRSDGRSGKKVTRICRDKKSRSAIAQEHKKFISKMRQAVENLRLSPKIDTPLPTPFTTPLASPISAAQTSVVAKLPPRPSLRSDAPSKGDLDRSGSSDGTPPPEKDSEKSNPASALKFSFRSLPKKFNKTSWPFMSKVKGEGGQDVSPDGVGMPVGRLQPEGKEETTRANVTPTDPRFSASSSSSHPRHKTLAHIPVLRVGETSNIYKDIAQQQQQLQEELSWQRQEGSSWQHQPDLQSPQFFGEQSRTGDWHAHQRSPFVHHQHDYDSPHHHHHHHHHHNMTSSHPYDSSQHHRHPPPQFENTDEPVASHRPQRSYDGSTFTPPSSRSLTTVSLKMKPHDGWYSQGISSNDCKGCMVYTPEIQYKTYVGSKGSPKYVTTLKVNCDEEVGNSIHSPDENAFGFHLVQSPQNFHKDVAWTRSARV